MISGSCKAWGLESTNCVSDAIAPATHFGGHLACWLASWNHHRSPAALCIQGAQCDKTAASFTSPMEASHSRSEVAYFL